MEKTQFEKGVLAYEASITAVDEVRKISLKGWDDGYLAFSNTERRLREVDIELGSLLDGNFEGLLAVEGYLMEIGLWRRLENIYEEVSVEREDAGFFRQWWKLEKLSNGDKRGNCFYREVNTLPRPNSIFKETGLRSLEVIVQDCRLHFFMTVAGDKP